MFFCRESVDFSCLWSFGLKELRQKLKNKLYSETSELAENVFEFSKLVSVFKHLIC